MMKNRTPEFTIMYEYIQTFGEKLASIDRITQRVVKEQSGRLVGWLVLLLYVPSQQLFSQVGTDSRVYHYV